MKKIMFNDQYGLTQSVLNGTKTMTRRIIPNVDIIRHFNPRFFPDNRDPSAYYRDWRGMCRLLDSSGKYILPKYSVGEVLAIAQPYKDAIHPLDWVNREIYQDTVAWNNKMFVKAEYMPHRIRITDLKVERLQDISDEDCIKEGLLVGEIEPKMYGFKVGKHVNSYLSPREAFAALIDRICCKGTWNSNPFVFAYTFNLVD